MIGFFLKLILIVICISKIHSWIADELINPYKLICCIGKKGSGKTTDIAKNIRKDLKDGWIVYSNVEVPGAIMYDPKMIGKLAFPPNSSIYLDEIALLFWNRNYKQFSKDALTYFKMQRQLKNKVTIYSQTLDFDLSIKNLIDKFYILKNVFTTFTLKREVKKVLDIKKDKDGKGDLVDCYDYVSFFSGGWHFTYIPKYIPLFSSYNPPEYEYFKGEPLPLDISIYKDGNHNFFARFIVHEFVRVYSRVSLDVQALKVRLQGGRSAPSDRADERSDTAERVPTSQEDSSGVTTTTPESAMCQVTEEEENEDVTRPKQETEE